MELTIHHDYDLAPHTTMRTPAKARHYIQVTTNTGLSEARRRGLLKDVVILGGGSNTLFTTADVEATVLNPAMMVITVDPVDDNIVRLNVEAGVKLDDLVNMTCNLGLWGLEALAMIPGSIGGAVTQNVGAYGAELADCVESVQLFDIATGEFVNVAADEMQFGYRYSRLKSNEWKGRMVVVSVTIKLTRTQQRQVTYEALAKRVQGANPMTPDLVKGCVCEMRRDKLPDIADVGSVGSYFVNPILDADTAQRLLEVHPDAPNYPIGDGAVKMSAAWLIDQAGCKTLSAGGASVWQKQPLVIVNTEGKATADDVVALERMIIEKVYDKFGITLTPEVVKV